MIDHYRRKKDKAELELEFNVPIGYDGKYIHFYIWKNNGALWDNVDPAGDPEWKDSFPACCLCFTKEAKLQAEIHLVVGKFGVGVVTHELTHFFFYWLDEFDIEDEEDACLAMGEWNTRFWQKYYKLVKE